MATQYDPTGTSYERFMAGVGKAFHDPYLRGKQLLGLSSQDDVDEAARLDQPLMKTGLGLAGNIAGQQALSLPIAGGVGALGKGVAALAPGLTSRLAPVVGGLASAATQGAAQGALQPVTSGETALGNIRNNAAVGAAGQALASGAAAAARPAWQAIKPGMQSAVANAMQYGLPITRSQMTGNLKGATAALGSLPLGGGRQQQEKLMGEYTRKLTNTFGQDSDNAITAIGQAKKDLGTRYDNLFSGQNWHISEGQQQQLDSIPLTHYAMTGDGAAQSQLQAVVDHMRNINQTQGGTLTGPQYQGFRTNLTQNARSAANDPQMASSWRGVRDVLDNAMGNAMGPQARAERDTINQLYVNMKTVEKALPTADEGLTTGYVAPAKLARTLTSVSPKNELNRQFMQAPVGGSTDLANLTQAANTFVPERMAETADVHSEIPLMDIIKKFGPEVGTTAGLAAAGFGAAHFAEPDSWLEKHPVYSTLGAMGAGALLGGTAGRALNSQFAVRGNPALYDVLSKLSTSRMAAPLAASTFNAAQATTPSFSKESEASKASAPDLFQGLERAPNDEEFGAGMQRAPAE